MRLPMVAPGKASGTFGSTSFLHRGHQSRRMICSVTMGVIPSGISSMKRLRKPGHTFHPALAIGAAQNWMGESRSIRAGGAR